MGRTLDLNGPRFSITQDLGTRVGQNLFHSFRSFNLSQGQIAIFSGEAGIQNILARVTGNQPSSIDGTLASSVAGASLYFMNPAGVLFGPNARLDLSGNFAVTTAHEIRLESGGRFPSDAAAPVTLTAAAPAAFGFANSSPAKVTFKGSRVALQTGKGFSISGGDLTFSEGADVSSPSGTVTLVATRSPGALPLDGYSTADFSELGDIGIEGGAQVKASGATAGSIRVEAGNLAITKSTPNGRFSSLRSETDGEGTGGSIQVRARETVRLDFGNIVSQSSANASGKGASIRVDAEHAELVGTGRITSISFGAADAGDIELHARRIDIAEPGSDSANTGIRAGAAGLGSAGRVSIHADELVIRDGGSINTSSTGGNAGAIVIDAGDVLLDDGALLAHSNFLKDSSGRGGDISLTGSRSIRLNHSRIRTSSDNGTLAGNVRLTGGSIALHQATINTDSRIKDGTNLYPGSGTGGDISLEATGNISIVGDPTGRLPTGMFSSVFGSDAHDAAGNILIKGASLEILDGATIYSRAVGEGRGGSTIVDVSGDIIFDGGPKHLLTGLVTSPVVAGEKAAGVSGRARVDGVNFSLSQGGRVHTTTAGSGQAGEIFVKLTGALTIDGDFDPNAAAGLYSESVQGAGNAGSIFVSAATATILRGGVITATAFSNSTGNSGSIQLAIDGAVTIDSVIPTSSYSTGIFAESSHGTAGLVSVTAGAIQLLGSSIISNQAITGGRATAVKVVADENLLIDGRDYPWWATGGILAGRPLKVPTTFPSGDIFILAPQVSIVRGGVVSTRSNGSDAGNISITSERADLIVSGGSEVSVQSITANAGTIRLTAEGDADVRIRSSVISAHAERAGGSILITSSRGDLIVSGGSEVSVRSTTLDAGDVRLTARGNGDVMIQGSVISARAERAGGNLSLNGRFLVARDHTVLEANAAQGDGGRFESHGLLFVHPNSPPPRVDSIAGQAGIVDIRNSVDIQSALARLPEGLAATVASISLGCDRLRPDASTLDPRGLYQGLAWPSLWTPLSAREPEVLP